MQKFCVPQKSHLVFGLLFGIYFFFFIWQRWTSDPETGWQHIIGSDGKGHYSYLPHIFIDNDLTYRAEEHLYAVPTENGKYMNRFFCGTAILEVPFFFLGYGAAAIGGYELNGYSEPFAFCMALSAIFYVLAGFYFLYRIFQEQIGLNKDHALLAVIFGALGTNIIYYATIQSTFSHAYSFFTITFFIWQFHRTIENASRKNILISSFLLSLTIVIRPVNGVIILLLPFFFSGVHFFLNFCKKIILSKKILYLFIGGIIPAFLQCLLWKMQTGNWIEWSYKQEGFNFTHPELFRVLFSFRRGLFIYCPLLLISLLGFYFLWKENKWKSTGVLLFLIVFTFLISSWWHWSYGDTFGMRPFNDILPVFLLLFGILIWKSSGWLKKTVLVISSFAVFLNLIYAYQFTNGILNYSNMDKEKFFAVFLKISEKHKNVFGGSDDVPPYAPNGLESIHYFESKFDEYAIRSLSINGEEFPAGTEFYFPGNKSHIRHQWIEVNFRKKIFNDDGMKDVLFVVHCLDTVTGNTIYYGTVKVKEFPRESVLEWKKETLRIWLPRSFGAGNLVKLYLWNKGKENFYLDDLTIHAQLPIW